MAYWARGAVVRALRGMDSLDLRLALDRALGDSRRAHDLRLLRSELAGRPLVGGVGELAGLVRRGRVVPGQGGDRLDLLPPGRAARFDLAESNSIPLAVITAYNQAHPDQPY